MELENWRAVQEKPCNGKNKLKKKPPTVLQQSLSDCGEEFRLLVTQSFDDSTQQMSIGQQKCGIKTRYH